MTHPDCSCCVSYPCERTPDIFANCWGFSLAEGVTATPPKDWRPDFSACTAEDIKRLNEADARFGLPESLAQYEARQAQAWCSEVYQTNAFEL